MLCKGDAFVDEAYLDRFRESVAGPACSKTEEYISGELKAIIEKCLNEEVKRKAREKIVIH